MITTIDKIQNKRQDLLSQLNNLREFRRGAVSVIYRKCGKQACWCAEEGAKGHVQYIWSATIKRKSVAKNLRVGPELKKYLEETKRYKEFISISEELVNINEKLCEVQPVEHLEGEKELEALKKKLQRQLLRKRARK